MLMQARKMITIGKEAQHKKDALGMTIEDAFFIRTAVMSNSTPTMYGKLLDAIFEAYSLGVAAGLKGHR